MPILRTDFSGDPNLGLYGFATDSYCLTGFAGRKIEGALGVPVRHVTVMNTGFAGLFIAGNSSGIVIPSALEDEKPALRKYFGRVLVLKSRQTALGNLILMNDKGAVLSPLIKAQKKYVEKFFGLPCAVSTIAKQRIVGNLGIATNRGCLLHPKARKSEMETVEKTLGVSCDIGTVNFGSPYPGAGLMANSNGFVVSERTSGPELGRINEALGFL